MSNTPTVHSHAGSGSASVDRAETTVQLLIADDTNRQLLASFVDEWTTPVVRETVDDADLFLVDRASLTRHRADLLAHKRDQHPLFCPAVLLSRDERQSGDEVVSVDGSGTPLLIDEHLTMPVRKPVLARRLRNLLARRTQARLLQRKTDRLDRFASRLSHELRNPLNLLDGYLAVAREQRDPEAFDTCQTAIDRMERMIADTLLLARDGDADVDPCAVSLPDVADACWDAVDAPEARTDVTTDQRVYADEDRLRALVTNLFRNAVEHGGTEVTITVGGLADGFFVADDGVGIPPGEREAIFDDGHTTGASGVGIGLTVVAEIVAAHGWEITVTDSAADGARFEVTGVESTAE